MYTEPTKKLLLLNILDILQKYTDGEHKLKQSEIEDKLAEEILSGNVNAGDKVSIKVEDKKVIFKTQK